MINKNGLLLIVFLSVLVRSEIVKPQSSITAHIANFKQGTTKKIAQTDILRCFNANCSTKNYDLATKSVTTTTSMEKESQRGRFKFRNKLQGNGATRLKQKKTPIESEFIGLNGRTRNPSRNFKQQNTIIARKPIIRQITLIPIGNKAIKSTTRLFNSAHLNRFEYKSYKKSDVKRIVHSSITSTPDRPKNFEVVGFETPNRLKSKGSPLPFVSTRNVKFRTSKQYQPVSHRTTAALTTNKKRPSNTKSPPINNPNSIFIPSAVIIKYIKKTTIADDETDYSETTDSETENEDDYDRKAEKQSLKTTKKLSQKLTTKTVKETTKKEKKKDENKTSQNNDKNSASGKPKKPEKEDHENEDNKNDEDEKGDDDEGGEEKGDDEKDDKEGDEEKGDEEDDSDDEDTTDEAEKTVAMRKTTKNMIKTTTAKPTTKSPTKPITLPLPTTKIVTTTATKKTEAPTTIPATIKTVAPTTIPATTKIAAPTTVPATITQLLTPVNVKTDPPTVANIVAEITSTSKLKGTTIQNIVNTIKPNSVKTDSADNQGESELENMDTESLVLTVTTKSRTQIAATKTTEMIKATIMTTEVATTKQQDDVDMAEIMVVPKVSQKISEFTKIPEDYENYNMDEAAKAVQATTKKNPAALLGMFSNKFGVESNDTQKNNSSSSSGNSLLSAASSVIAGSGGLSNVLKNVNLGKLFG